MSTEAQNLWKFARSLLSNVRARRMGMIILALIPVAIIFFNMFPMMIAESETPLRATIIVRNRLLALFGLICLFTLLATWISAEWLIVKRTRTIVAAAARLRAGDFSARTDIVHGSRGTDELATIFNTLAKALQEREQENRRLIAETQKLNEELHRKWQATPEMQR
jgi:methyl-accepting chemotaxis protein